MKRKKIISNTFRDKIIFDFLRRQDAYSILLTYIDNELDQAMKLKRLHQNWDKNGNNQASSSRPNNNPIPALVHMLIKSQRPSPSPSSAMYGGEVMTILLVVGIVSLVLAILYIERHRATQARRDIETNGTHNGGKRTTLRHKWFRTGGKRRHTKRH